MPPFEKGAGAAIIVVPGIQGRWEWMAPAIDALSVRFRVHTFSLQASTARSVFDDSDARIDAILDGGRLRDAAIVGVSFGGLIAARYAARGAKNEGGERPNGPAHVPLGPGVGLPAGRRRRDEHEPAHTSGMAGGIARGDEPPE